MVSLTPTLLADVRDGRAAPDLPWSAGDLRFREASIPFEHPKPFRAALRTGPTPCHRQVANPPVSPTDR